MSAPGMGRAGGTSSSPVLLLPEVARSPTFIACTDVLWNTLSWEVAPITLRDQKQLTALFRFWSSYSQPSRCSGSKVHWRKKILVVSVLIFLQPASRYSGSKVHWRANILIILRAFVLVCLHSPEARWITGIKTHQSILWRMGCRIILLAAAYIFA